MEKYSDGDLQKFEKFLLSKADNDDGGIWPVMYKKELAKG